MNCVKCGRETAEEQVFCDVCLGEMEGYPVKPGTAIHIPSRNVAEEPKKNQSRRKTIRTPSEQITHLKRKLLRLRILAVLLLLIVGGLCFAMHPTAAEIMRCLNRSSVPAAQTRWAGSPDPVPVPHQQ